MNKVLKIVLVILAAVIALVLIIAAFLPKEVHVERSIIVETHAMCPFNQVNNLMLWENWTPFDDDNSMVNTYEGPRSGVGAVSRWETEKQGSGSMIIVESVPFSKVVTELTMGGGNSIGYFTFEEVEEGKTNVTWVWDDEAGYPLGRIMYATFKGWMEDAFDRGLASIKEQCEGMDMEGENIAPVHVARNAPVTDDAEAGPHLYILYTNERDVAYIEDEGSWEEIEAKMDKNFTELMTFVYSNGLEGYGNPFTVWKEWDEENMYAKFDCGIAVKELIEPSGNVKMKKYEPMKVVTGIHYGSYETSGNMYNAIMAYIEANALVMAGPPIEAYIIDPSQEPDTSKWETAVMWPVL